MPLRGSPHTSRLEQIHAGEGLPKHPGIIYAEPLPEHPEGPLI